MPIEDEAGVRMAMAVLVGALVRSLEPSNPGLMERYESQLEQAHAKLRGASPDAQTLAETLEWAHYLLRTA
jgi:hypothetical protein